MTKTMIFTEAHRRTRETPYTCVSYNSLFSSYLREVYREVKAKKNHVGFTKMNSNVVVLKETEKAILIGCKNNAFEMWAPKSQSVVDGSIFVKDWLIKKNRDARYFAA
jgi:hypothetical protein